MANLIKNQDELASFQGLAERLNTRNDKALILFKALISSFIFFLIKNLFIKFMKTFVESI